MKKKLAPIALLAFFAIAGCKSGSDKSAEAVDSTATTAVDTVVKTPEFKPFDLIEINHSVKDFATWKKAFDTDSTARNESGLKFIVIGRGMENPNSLCIAMEATDVQKAKDFSANPRLKDVMSKAGVTSKPEINFFHVLRFNAESKEKQWVLITHKVKDFDAWLKVYDGEGTAKRAEEGMVDVVLARGVDDPSIVHIVFDITDMAKAKAALTSEDKKKLMMSAGVEGAPKIEFFNTAE